MNYRQEIMKMVNNETYNNISLYYGQTTVFDILRISRKEHVHSNFLAWIFDDNASHGLSTYPLKKFLQTVIFASEQAVNKNVECDGVELLSEPTVTGKYNIENVTVRREMPAKSKEPDQKDGRIDIYITLDLTIDKDVTPLKIIIENKTGTGEHDAQTKTYFKWAKQEEAKVEKQENGAKTLFVFLAPFSNGDYNAEKRPCKCKGFIALNYQYLADYMIAPCLNKCSSEQAIMFIKDYLRNLGKPSFDVEDDSEIKADVKFIMATSAEERQKCYRLWQENNELLLEICKVVVENDEEDGLLKNFLEENKTLFSAVFGALSENEEIDERKREKFKACVDYLSPRTVEQSKRRFILKDKGEQVGKDGLTIKRLVKVLVNHYFEMQKEPFSIEDLQKAFPDDLTKSEGETQIAAFICKDMPKGKSKKGEECDSTLYDKSDKGDFYFCNDWHDVHKSGGSNIDGFIEYAKKELGYEISE